MVTATGGHGPTQGGSDTSEQFAELLAAALAKPAVVPTMPARDGALRGVGRQVIPSRPKDVHGDVSGLLTSMRKDEHDAPPNAHAGA